MSLRNYQERAVAAVLAQWDGGTRAVCLVAPTGAGKTRLGEELIADERPAVWIAHRRELITQTAKRLRVRFGRSAVGVIMPGEYETPRARVQVCTVQTLIAKGRWPEAKTLVLDEAHHYAAAEWSDVAGRYAHARAVGLTATPERRDGEPLGDIFGGLVVAASYSELIAGKWLVPARVYRPATYLGNDLAQDPVDAWFKCSDGSQAFVFCARVSIAADVAQRFRDAGISAALVEAKTPTREREDALARFGAGKLRVLTNVNALTEGVDVPEARTVILARAFGHVGGYLQAAGRGLRPSKDKPDMILVDLVGCSLRHGLPTDDRKYSLEGRAISGGEAPHVGGVAPEFKQDVVGAELVIAARGAMQDGRAATVVVREPVDDVARRAEYGRLLRAGVPKMLASTRYFETFGEWPKGGLR